MRTINYWPVSIDTNVEPFRIDYVSVTSIICSWYQIIFIKLSESLLLCKYYSIYVKATFVMILTLLMKYCQEWSMYLVYLCNSFIFNFFLFFYFILLLLAFLYCAYKVQISSWAFVWEDLEAVHYRKHFLKMLKRQICKTVWKIFTSWFDKYCIYVFLDLVEVPRGSL